MILCESVPFKTCTEKQTIIAGLSRIATPHAKKLAELLGGEERKEEIDIKALLREILGKPFDDCSDSDIGRFDGVVKSLFEQAKQPAPTSKPNPDETKPIPLNSPIFPVTSGVATSFDKLEDEIRKLITASTIAKADIRKVLQQLLSSYGD